MTTKIKILIHAGLLILLFAIFCLAMVLPAQRNVGRARDGLDKAERDKITAERRLAMLQVKMDVFAPVPPDALTSDQLDVFLHDLQARCRETGAFIERVKQIGRSEDRAFAEGLVYPKKIQIGLTGDFPSLYRMLLRLEDYHKLMTTDAMRFEVGYERGEPMKVIVSSTVYILDVGETPVTPRPAPARIVP